MNKPTTPSTISSDSLVTATGGFSARWAANHPYRAAGYFAAHPHQQERFEANHPVLGARIDRIQSRWGM